jgi:hypothetical protein
MPEVIIRKFQIVPHREHKAVQSFSNDHGLLFSRTKRIDSPGGTRCRGLEGVGRRLLKVREILTVFLSQFKNEEYCEEYFLILYEACLSAVTAHHSRLLSAEANNFYQSRFYVRDCYQKRNVAS